ncbi:MAG: hypothetical protein MI743_21015 [Sneathiellales bacterium]|nr:hypothetical protein [Sneathiellales bacterium]
MSHGKLLLGVIALQSQSYSGNFGRLCRNLPPWTPKDVPEHKLEEHFLNFANNEMVEAPGISPSEIASNDALRERLDAEFNSRIPAGYTYLGQFIDHDITLDITPLSEADADPNKLHNFRTPRLDLDCIYGSGPDVQPYLYEQDSNGKFTGRMLLGEINNTSFADLPRNQAGLAIIGDKRNDENAVVAQIQLAFIKAHNELVERSVDTGLARLGAEAFSHARQTLMWLYQWIVWNDFLKRITDSGIHQCALKKSKTCGNRDIWELGLGDIYNWKQHPFMPVEFSAAAYRFGHSMARNSYQTNNSVQNGAGFGKFFPLFDLETDVKNDLSGFRPLAANRVIQWDWFLDMKSSSGPFPQRARKIDTRLSNALARLREDPDDPTSVRNVLAARNLLRGVKMKLPSGPDVAHKFGFQPIELAPQEPHSLWYYILKEAATLPLEETDQQLGNVGSTILCATFAGLLKGDPRSWINVQPNWHPDQDVLLEAGDNQDPGDWTFASIIRLSGLPVDATSFTP